MQLKYLVLSSSRSNSSTFTLPDSTTDAVIDIGNASTTFSGTTIIKATDTSVEFGNDLNIFDIDLNYTSSNIPDIVFNTPSIFKLTSGQSYELFSNTTFNGTVNCDNATFSRETKAKSICNITLKDDNKIFTNMILSSCGTLILENVSTNGTITSFTNNSSPDIGLQITSGSVNLDTVNIKDSTNEFVKLVSHSGTIKDLKLDTTTTFNKTFVEIASGVTTTFSTTDTNEIGIYIKGTLDHDGSVGIIVDNDTSRTISDLVVDSGDTLVLSSNMKLPSNLVVNGTLTSNGKTFTTTGTGNITINSQSSLQTTTFNSCGLIKLTNLDTNSVMSSLTLNSCTGLQVEGGNVDITTLTINSATSDYIISDNHTGIISGITFDVDSNFSTKNLINLGSSSNTSTTLSGEITIKSTDTNVELTKDLDIFKVTSYDTAETFPNVKLDSSTEFKLDTNTTEYKIFSNITFEGGVNCNGSKFTRDSNANSNCNVTLKGDNKIFTNMTLESCGTLILDTLTTNNTISDFTNTSSPTLGLQISSGSVDVSTLNINSATGKYLVLSSHSGVISNSTFTLPDSTTDAVIDIQSGSTTFSGTTTLKATDTSVEFDNNLNIFDIYSGYTSSSIPDIVFSTPSIFKLTSGQSYELFSNTTFNGTVNCDNATISRGTDAKSICNITFVNNNKTY